jgi:tetratricopeptide (TPR) repeat protein
LRVPTLTVYSRKGMYDQSIAELQEALRAHGDTQDAEDLGEDFKALGFEPLMRQLHQATLDSLKEDAKTRYVSPLGFAISYAKLGDKDQAFPWLEKAVAEHCPPVVSLKTNPEFDGLRSDPRFTALVKRMGLP